MSIIIWDLVDKFKFTIINSVHGIQGLQRTRSFRNLITLHKSVPHYFSWVGPTRAGYEGAIAFQRSHNFEGAITGLLKISKKDDVEFFITNCNQDEGYSMITIQDGIVSLQPASGAIGLSADRFKGITTSNIIPTLSQVGTEDITLSPFYNMILVNKHDVKISLLKAEYDEVPRSFINPQIGYLRFPQSFINLGYSSQINIISEWQYNLEGKSNEEANLWL